MECPFSKTPGPAPSSQFQKGHAPTPMKRNAPFSKTNVSSQEPTSLPLSWIANPNRASDNSRKGRTALSCARKPSSDSEKVGAVWAFACGVGFSARPMDTGAAINTPIRIARRFPMRPPSLPKSTTNRSKLTLFIAYLINVNGTLPTSRELHKVVQCATAHPVRDTGSSGPVLCLDHCLRDGVNNSHSAGINTVAPDAPRPSLTFAVDASGDQ